jgi:hypothetical protein
MKQVMNLFLILAAIVDENVDELEAKLKDLLVLLF